MHLSRGEGDHGASDEYFYYTNGVLFFIYASEGSWQFTGSTLANGESETVDRVRESRIYIENGSVIRHLVKEVSASNPSELAGRLAKAENAPASDPEGAKEFLRRGLGAIGVRNASDLGRLLIYSE